MAAKKLGFDIEVTKQKDMRGKILGFRAKFGNVEIDTKTEAEAVEGVRKAVVALTSEPLSPAVMWSLDRQEVWTKLKADLVVAAREAGEVES